MPTRVAGDRAAAAAPTVAMVFATAPGVPAGPAALLPWGAGTVIGRLTGQLAGLGVREIAVVTRPAWEADVRRASEQPGGTVVVRSSSGVDDDLRRLAALARTSRGPLIVAYGEIVTQRAAISALVADAGRFSALLAGSRARPAAFRVQFGRGRVISAASAFHSVRRPNATFLGVLRVATADLESLALAAEHLAGLASSMPSSWEEELDRKALRWRVLAGRGGRDLEQAPGLDDHAGPEDPPDEEPVEAPVEEVVLGPDQQAELANRVAAARDDALALALVGLVRGGVRVNAQYLRRFYWARPLTTAAVETSEQRIAQYDEDRLLLDVAVKGNDGFFTTFFVSPYSKYIARWAARRGITPNQVTIASMVIGALAAGAFAAGTRAGLIAGAVLLQAAFTTDCVDGQLARYKRQFSRLGAYLDSMFDRGKEYLVFAGLAVGAARAGDPVWLLACAALTLQTVRHMSDFSYLATQQAKLGTVDHPPLEEPLDSTAKAAQARRAASTRGERPRRSLASKLLTVWHRLDDQPAMPWLKRMIPFPIGERFALISLTAALFTPRVTFVAFLVWCGLGVVYTQAGRVLRAIR